MGLKKLENGILCLNFWIIKGIPKIKTLNSKNNMAVLNYST